MANRDSHGKFLPGHSIKSPGRPALSAELPTIEGLKIACNAEDTARVIEQLRDLALRGNVRAAGLYLAYAIGKPVELGFEDRITAIEEALKADGKL